MRASEASVGVSGRGSVRSRWGKRWAGRRDSGQSSVEYAIVLLAFLSTIVAMGVVWHEVRDGALLEVARSAASHSLADGITIGLMQDIATF